MHLMQLKLRRPFYVPFPVKLHCKHQETAKEEWKNLLTYKPWRYGPFMDQ